MINPFLKWAGGKRWLVARRLLPVPIKFDRYVEPFVGSGAVFFFLRPQKALLADLNEDLMRLYRVIRDRPRLLRRKMSVHQTKHSKAYYYEVRANDPTDETDRAARFLYLNRTCWNGLYRVNLKGEFNVPKGTKSTVLFDNDNFDAISGVLKRAKLECCDFERVIDQCGERDFVFIDPPYTVKHNNNNFLKYNERIFSWDDQIRLRDAVLRAKRHGARIAVMNADHRSVRALYDGVAEYVRLSRYSVLAGDHAARVETTEALFLANFEEGLANGHMSA